MGLSYLRRDARPAAKRRGSKVGSAAASQTGRLRPLALEAMEGRLMLTHVAPVLDSAGTPAFTAIAENVTLADNMGSTVSDMLASGGAGFLTLDSANGAQDGIAVIGQQGDQHGLWQYSINGGANWSALSPTVTGSSALLLRGVDKLRFLPDAGYSGQVSLQFLAWDQTDGASAGSQQDLTLWQSHGGSTAYSDNSASATLDVTAAATAPSFTLMAATSANENNTVTASGGSPGGSNANVIPVSGFASNINIGSGGSSLVNFSVSDADGNFSTLFAQAPQIDSYGTLTYQLNPDVSGMATLNVTASNGAATSAAQQATITVNNINDPPTLDPISAPAPVLDMAGQQSIALSGVTAGLNESQNLTVSAATVAETGDNPNLLSNVYVDYTSPNSTATLHYTPVSSPQPQTGTLHVTVTVSDNGGTANGGVDTSTPQTFVVTVRKQPSFTTGPTERVANTLGTQSFANWATSIDLGYPSGASGMFTVNVTSGSGLFNSTPTISSGGTLSVTPKPGQYGTANLTATLKSTLNGYDVFSTAQSFSITVVTPPTANVETYVVNYTGSSAAGSSIGVLANDSDPNSGGSMTAQIASGGAPSRGTMSLNSDGSFTYTAGGSFQGVDHFSYQAVDGPAASGAIAETLYSHEGALVRNLYYQILGRGPSDAEVGAYAPGLHSGATTGSVLQSLTESDEKLNVVIGNYYSAYLGRAADSGGLTYFKGVWRTNGGPEQVIIGLATSAECFSHAGGNNTGWVSLMYQNILGRPADSGALGYFVPRLDQGTMSEQQVVNVLLTSAEYRDNVVQSFYNTYLYRSAGTSEQDYYVNLMNQGESQRQIQQRIVNAPEYYNNPTVPTAGSAVRWFH